MALANTFGWSLSREAMFRDCARRYYFHYYLSWGGWEKSAPAIAREAFLLKRLVSLSLWRGQLVHYIATKVLGSMRAKGRVPDRDAVIAYLKERFDRQFAFSKERRYLTTPKKIGQRINIDWLALLDHEYSREIPPATLERTRKECIEAIDTLLVSPILAEVLGTDRNKWKIENLEEAEFSQQFDFRGIAVYVKTDFMFEDRDGNLVIVDWKTGKAAEGNIEDSMEETNGTSTQLGVYSYYASKVLLVPVESIRLCEVLLVEKGTIDEHRSSPEILASAEERIARGISILSSVLVRGDPKRNEPMPVEHFPTIDDSRCRFCNFFRICKDQDSPMRLS